MRPLIYAAVLLSGTAFAGVTSPSSTPSGTTTFPTFNGTKITSSWVNSLATKEGISADDWGYCDRSLNDCVLLYQSTGPSSATAYMVVNKKCTTGDGCFGGYLAPLELRWEATANGVETDFYIGYSTSLSGVAARKYFGTSLNEVVYDEDVWHPEYCSESTFRNSDGSWDTEEYSCYQIWYATSGSADELSCDQVGEIWLDDQLMTYADGIQAGRQQMLEDKWTLMALSAAVSFVRAVDLEDPLGTLGAPVDAAGDAEAVGALYDMLTDDLTEYRTLELKSYASQLVSQCETGTNDLEGTIDENGDFDGEVEPDGSGECEAGFKTGWLDDVSYVNGDGQDCIADFSVFCICEGGDPDAEGNCNCDCEGTAIAPVCGEGSTFEEPDDTGIGDISF